MCFSSKQDLSKILRIIIYGKTLCICDLAVYGLVNGPKAIFTSKHSCHVVSAASSCKSQYTIYTYS